MSLTNFVVFHNQESLDYFRANNPGFECEFILVGQNPPEIKGLDKYHIAANLPRNLEHLPSLLTFTAWYAISKNQLYDKYFVGIYEYDVKFTGKIPEDELWEDCISGFIKRNLPDKLFLDVCPGIKNILGINSFNQPFWNATSNFIMSYKFLTQFVNWYICLVPEILKYHNHSHFHERMINIFAYEYGYFNKNLPILEHAQLNSHKQSL